MFSNRVSPSILHFSQPTLSHLFTFSARQSGCEFIEHSFVGAFHNRVKVGGFARPERALLVPPRFELCNKSADKLTIEH